MINGHTYEFFDKELEWPGRPDAEGGAIDGIGSGFAEIVGVDVPTLRNVHRPNATINPYTGQAETYIMFEGAEGFGDVCVVTDDFLYTFSCSTAMWDWGNVRIARAPIAGDAFKLRENYTFWNGSAWVADSAAAIPIMQAPDGGIGSIEWNDYLGCWLYTYVRVFDNELAMRVHLRLLACKK